MKGKQCPKALYLLKHRRDLLQPISASQQAIFDQGKQVGELAWRLFPGGIDCTSETHSDHTVALQRTQQALLEQDVIYEAAFLHDEVLAVLDILVREGDEWRAIEVKSSTTVKAQFLDDAALQYHVITGAGVPLRSIQVMHVNNKYTRQGALDVDQLFHLEDVTADVQQRQAEVRRTITGLKEMLSKGEEPVRAIGPHCDSPYSCDLKDHCWKDVPVPSVLDLARGRTRGFELYAQGIRRLEDIPADAELTAKQQRQIAVQRSGIADIDPDRIRQFLSGLTYPIHCLDFETFASAVPPYDGTRPYQAIPFQFSIHVIDAPGTEPRHNEFLADGLRDPREELLVSMLNVIGNEGSVLAYNLGFERGILQELAAQFPQHSVAIEGIIARCQDLAIPFQHQWYYDRGMNGRYSIKQVLPALVPDMSYEGMPVSDGLAASAAFAQIVNGRMPDDMIRWRKDMLAYCELDTLAMVKLLHVLERV